MLVRCCPHRWPALLRGVHVIQLRLIICRIIVPGIERIIQIKPLGVKLIEGVVPLLLGGRALVLIGEGLPLPGAVGMLVDGIAHKGLGTLGLVGMEALRMDKDLVSGVLGGGPAVFHLFVAAPVQIPVLGLQVLHIA